MMMTLRRLQAETRPVIPTRWNRVAGVPFASHAGSVALRARPIDRGDCRPLVPAWAAAFPASRRLLGHDVFARLVGRFALLCPTGDAATFSAGLPRFMRTEPGWRRIPYAADLAALEWAMHRAATARQAPSLSLGELEAVPHEALATLRFRPHRAWSLFTSPYPVLDIWRASQTDGGKHVAIEFCGAPTRLVVGRSRQQAVTWRRLSRPRFTFLRRLEAGVTFGAAAAAVRPGEAFDVIGFVAGLVEDGVFAPLDRGADGARARSRDQGTGRLRRPGWHAPGRAVATIAQAAAAT